MILAKQVDSKTIVPRSTELNTYVDVVKYYNPHTTNPDSYYMFTPSFVKTDGNEENYNNGGVIFENFWQGSKVWETCYEQKSSPSFKYFNYTCYGMRGYELHYKDDSVLPVYFTWRNKLYDCKYPIRAPNGIKRNKKYLFHLLKKHDGEEVRLDVIQARRELYLKEYSRLVKKSLEFYKLIHILNEKRNIVICDNNLTDGELLDIDKIETYMNNKETSFGAGLSLAHTLLTYKIEYEQSQLN